MKKIFTFLFLSMIVGLNAQFNINALNIPYVIDFDGFRADSTAAPGAITGINTNWFSIKGFTGANAVNNVDFGTINNSPKLKLGVSNAVNPTASGIYAFKTDINDTSDKALGFQPTGGDLTPGFIYFKIKNTSTQTINNITFGFTLEVKNNEARSNNIQIYHGSDTTFANMTLMQTYVSPLAADPTPAWVDSNLLVNVTGLNVLPNAEYVFLIRTDDVGGSGSRDEFAINDLFVVSGGGTSVSALDAGFTLNDSTICEGSTVTFTNTTITTPPSTNVVYIWNFGDGSPFASTTNTTHQFDSVGNFTVTLYAIDTISFLFDSAKKTVTVYEVPNANYTSTNNGNGNYTFSAPITSASNYTYIWTVNGSAAGTSQPTLNQTFASSGNYTVCLTVTNPLGPCVGFFCDTINAVILPPNTLNVNLTLSDSVICKDDSAGITSLVVTGGTAPLTYTWTLNGSPIPPPSIGLLSQVSNVGPLTVAVTVTDSNNYTKSDTATLLVLPLPNANFTLTPTSSNPSQYILNPAGSALLTYTLFVNGVPSPLIGAAPYLVTFPGNGAYAVCLKALNANTTCSDSTCQNVNISLGLIGIAKKAEFKIYPNPANDIIYIENVEGKATVNVYNSIGQIVKQESINGDSKLNIKNLTEGIYFVEIKSAFGTKTMKLMVQ
jgi:hypothetical protein